MMIKALILVHLWSLVVAGVAWFLQRDGDGRVGASFPAPNIWLVLIALCFLPSLLYLIPFGAAISVPDMEILALIPSQVGATPADGFAAMNYLWVYAGLCFLLISRTLWQWSRLQRLPLMPTNQPDVFTTTYPVPPLTLSWPRRAVVIPDGFQIQTALIRHERAHLRHYDAEITLFFLLLRDAMLRSPGVSYLVRQWRLSIELRADHAATRLLTPPERKAYASLLLSLQRPNHTDDGTLPCPTARLSSTHHRTVKMRLGEIMQTQPRARKRRWGAALFLTSIAASGIGIVSAGATANNAALSARSSPDDYVLVDYTRQTPLKLPSSCPGLVRDLKARGIEFEEIETTVNGRLASRHKTKLGTVVLSHDVRRDGSVYNPGIINSTHSCFEAEARAAITQWQTEAQNSEIQNVAVKLDFTMSAATPEELNDKLKSYLQ